jgi:RNA polymerase sigma factor (sigma-70 family)
MDALTQGGFDLLLARLASDRQQAGVAYELLRLKLVKFFEWRACPFPEELADDAINRVARNLQSGEEVRNLAAYSMGIARNVFLESLRARRHEEAVENLPEVSAPQPDDLERRFQCLEQCLRQLPPQDSELVLQYYANEKPDRIAARREMAQRMGIPLNALRIRTHRIRARLEACVGQCMKETAK